MALQEVPPEVKVRLRRAYEALNPAALKPTIDAQLNILYQAYQAKQTAAQKVEPMMRPMKKITPATVSFLMTQPRLVSVSS